MNALLELLRISLAPTVVADLCGGVALAKHDAGREEGLELVARLTVTSLLLFCGGMALNAWVDREEDRATQPKRPLPSGRIRPSVALGIAIAGLAAAPIVAFGLAGTYALDAAKWAAGLAAVIVLYHTPLKRSAFIGPLLLGVIRGGDLLLGSIAYSGLDQGFAVAWPAAAAYAAYVAGASFVAHEEDRTPSIVVVRSGGALAFIAIVVNGAIAWQHSRGAAGSALPWVVAMLTFMHVVSVRGAALLFRRGGFGLIPLRSFARLLLSRLPYVPAVAAFGAASGDLGGIAIATFFVVILLVRFVPPT